jgi:hypothetical protein
MQRTLEYAITGSDNKNSYNETGNEIDKIPMSEIYHHTAYNNDK